MPEFSMSVLKRIDLMYIDALCEKDILSVSFYTRWYT